MFKLLDELPKLPEPFLGCEIETLYRCYNTDWRRLTLYRCGEAVALKYGSRLYLSGQVDKAELEEFCRVMQISRIEALQHDVEGCFEGQKSLHSILVAGETAFALSQDVIKNDSLHIAFEILRQSDAAFAYHMQYFDYLSEVKTRIHRQLGEVYLLDGCATGAVWAKNETHGLVGYVATAPKVRGQGQGRRLLCHIAGELQGQGRVPYLVSFDQNTDRFYEKCGFTLAEKKAIIKFGPF